MASSKINFQFGKYQYFTSDRMSKHPALGKLISKIFGYTQVATYDRFLGFKKLLTYVPTDNIKTILDLGCGQGEFSIAMAEAFPNATVDAIDLDTESLRRVQKTVTHFNIKNVNVINSKIQDLPQKEYYDLIFSLDVFEHIKDEEKPYAACYEKLKKGGYLVIKVPNKEHVTIMPKAWFEEHNHWLEEEHVGQNDDLPDLIKRFKDHNFTIVSAFYSDGILSRLGWEVSHLFGRGGTIPHLIALPFCKLLMHIDLMKDNRKSGNYIQAVGRKD
jgi:precorrin-6B methylase 2